MNSTTRLFCLFVSLGLLVYTITRAYTLSFTHDESYSFLYASHDSFMEIISNRTTQISANNHILNTLSMKFFGGIFGNTELALRLQSVIAHVLYLCFTFLLLKNFRSNVTILLGFLLLNLNPYLLEFFSLARGYAMAISFMLIGIYYFIRYLQEEKRNDLVRCMLVSSLAVLANFSMLNYFLSVIFIQQVFLFSKYRNIKVHFGKSKTVIITLAIMIAICYEPLRKLIKYNSFDFGGTTGIWADTVHSSIGCFLYFKEYPFNAFLFIQLCILLTIISFVILMAYKWLKKELQQEDLTGGIIFLLLILIIIANIAQHFLLKSPYLMERFAVFLTPLFIFTLIALLDRLLFSYRASFRIIALLSISSLSYLMLFHFGKCANLQFASNWRYDADTKTMITDLAKEKEQSGKEKIKLGNTWLFEPTINFYRETKNLIWLEKATRKGIAGDYDYCYAGLEDADKLDSVAKTVIIQYPVSGSVLMK